MSIIRNLRLKKIIESVIFFEIIGKRKMYFSRYEKYRTYSVRKAIPKRTSYGFIVSISFRRSERNRPMIKHCLGTVMRICKMKIKRFFTFDQLINVIFGAFSGAAEPLATK